MAGIWTRLGDHWPWLTSRPPRTSPGDFLVAPFLSQHPNPICETAFRHRVALSTSHPDGIPRFFAGRVFVQPLTVSASYIINYFRINTSPVPDKRREPCTMTPPSTQLFFLPCSLSAGRRVVRFFVINYPRGGSVTLINRLTMALEQMDDVQWVLRQIRRRMLHEYYA